MCAIVGTLLASLVLSQLLTTVQSVTCHQYCVPNGCGRQSVDGKCDSQCLPGYGINTADHTCVPCDLQCEGSCNVNGKDKCDTICKVKFGIDKTTYKCKDCHPKCTSACNVRGPTKCDSTCMAGYVPNLSYECVMCDPNCVSCQTNGYLMCDPGKCKVGFGYNSATKKCAPCDANCAGGCVKPATCVSAGCTDPGYGTKLILGTTADYMCVSCDVNCDGSCKVSGGGKCDGPCKSGYSLGVTTKTCVLCSQKCVGGCSRSGTGFCDGPCEAGYGLGPTPGDATKNACYSCATHCTGGCSREGAGCCDSSSCTIGAYIAHPTKANCHICS